MWVCWIISKWKSYVKVIGNSNPVISIHAQYLQFVFWRFQPLDLWEVHHWWVQRFHWIQFPIWNFILVVYSNVPSFQTLRGFENIKCVKNYFYIAIYCLNMLPLVLDFLGRLQIFHHLWLPQLDRPSHKILRYNPR